MLMTILHLPRIIIFDWHGTLVDTSDAMYRAMDDMLRRMDEHGLDCRLTESSESTSEDDRKLIEYVRAHKRLHPKVVSDRKASRTDLLEVLFGRDDRAKELANRVYNGCYRRYFGEVKPFAPGIRAVLSELRQLGVKLGILTNRAREFLDKELDHIEQGSWIQLFDATVSGGDADSLKPSPAPVYRALQGLGATPGADVWYVGDSKSDTISAKTAGITSVFFNGAKGDAEWMRVIFPGTADDPHQPDHIVDGFQELLRLVKAAIEEGRKSES
jgi:phosphoglycolate phosphatase